MDTSSIKDSLARNGFVYTDVGDVRVTARGPKTPADPGNDGERSTVVRVVKDGADVEHSTHRSRGAAARRYVEHVEEYS
jgi:hypothetical protein